MKCPRCETALDASERKNVEIDVCSKCRGVWLDRGELDKIINRYDAYDREEERDNFRSYKETDHPKRKSFWQELFD